MDCSVAEDFYSLNEDIALEHAANTPEGVEGLEPSSGSATALSTSYLPSYPSSSPNQVNIQFAPLF